ncbi:hypothetical protein FOA43_001268 [Brettanomyces nanus]|uniref:Rho-GAP domain-containing protein n=1 Tax=Eeniella nana TaxID=13502 RepID=A0A875RZ75_EENNA|nr:uncharacterized protein FOA43_001268 [Brettanomyces nanus]QPG73953.1 hypothetical protein FOA43_001268 [Brettanomyces nanus]
MAILTGDCAYCADCFKCKSCKKPIEDLRYARTSKGLFCMSCHKILMEKKKKYDKMKKARKQRELRRYQRDQEPQENQPAEHSPLSVQSQQDQRDQRDQQDQQDQQVQMVQQAQHQQKQKAQQSQQAQQARQDQQAQQDQHDQQDQQAQQSQQAQQDQRDQQAQKVQLAQLADNSPQTQSLSQSSAFSGSVSPASSDSPISAMSENLRSFTPLSNLSHASLNQAKVVGRREKQTIRATQHSTAPAQELSAPTTPELPIAPPPRTLSTPTSSSSVSAAASSVSSAHLDLPSKPLIRNSSPEVPRQALPSLPNKNLDTIHRRGVIMDQSFLNPEQESFINLGDNDEDSNIDRSIDYANEDSNDDLLHIYDDDNIVTDTASLASKPASQSLSSAFVPLHSPQDAGLNIQGVTFPSQKRLDSPSTSKASSSGTFGALASPSIPNMNYTGTPGTRGTSESAKNSPAIIEGDGWKDFRVRKSPFRFGASGTDSSMQASAYPGSPSHSRKGSSSLGRSLTHVFHRHRKGNSSSISANVNGIDGSMPGTPYSITESSPEHNRTQSEHSTSAYATPPLPSSQGFHNRSFSESLQEALKEEDDGSGVLAERREQISQAERELRLLKSEINTLSATKAAMSRDIQNLQLQKRSLLSEITEKQEQLKNFNNSKTSLQDGRSEGSGKDGDSSTSTNHASSTPGYQAQNIPQYATNNFTGTTGIAAANGSYSSGKKAGGFMRRFFGGSQQSSSSLPTSVSSHSISGPLNVKQGEEALQTLRAQMGGPSPSNNNRVYEPPDEVLSSSPTKPQKQNLSSGIGSLIRSRSQNFLQLRTGGLGIHDFENNGISSSLSPIPASPVVTPGGLYELNLQQRAQCESRVIPYVITACMTDVSKRGLTSEGIYRVSGSALAIDKIERYFASLDTNTINQLSNQLSQKTAVKLDTDIHAVAGMLKRYLKKLPEPVIPFNGYEQFIEVAKLPNDQVRAQSMRQLLSMLPSTNLKVLKLLVAHLNAVAANEQYTKMTSSALATVFAPTLARERGGDPQREILDNGAKTRATEFLLRNATNVF